jgi:hypothetical protein
MVNIKDKYGFLKNVTAWENHRPLLLLALELTKGQVIELGCGDGSTPFLMKYCDGEDRTFKSYDSNKEWAERCGAVHVKDWYDNAIYEKCGVAFLDHAPGEERWVSALKFVDKADIIVLHDSEEGGAGNYMYDRIWTRFKYRLNYNKTGGGAGASAVSNTIDLHEYRKMNLGGFVFER